MSAYHYGISFLFIRSYEITTEGRWEQPCVVVKIKNMESLHPYSPAPFPLLNRVPMSLFSPAQRASQTEEDKKEASFKYEAK